ncbi:hypothetical protein G6O67_002637 [Ophiocordyceps sinensis]|uniref:Vezatin n=1 Tax=Ophiocordyceps sinensis TaxID=72228 RepID=A0A8H4V7S6_9HYPO|nr:hypothetical protein G6O67_002637 [Ophiocordyceps sinensis]
MESVVYNETPLADYLRDGGDESDPDWAPVGGSPLSSPERSSSPPSPSPFAPAGRPLVRARFRAKAPVAPHPVEPRTTSAWRAIRRKCSAALAASIDGSDNAKFIERFRYTIVASQLLNGQSITGHRPAAPTLAGAGAGHKHHSTQGILVPVLGALAVAMLLNWVRNSGALSHVTRKRLFLLLAALAASLFLGNILIRRQWLRYQREKCLSEMAAFVSNSHDFDSATEATLSLIQEVELVSRGFRISAPLPPVGRLEDRSQSRKCVRLRKTIKASFGDVLTRYNRASNVVKSFSEVTELEKYYDMYDIGDFDVSDALQGYNEADFDDAESLRTLKILAARFHTARKMLLCGLLALDANEGGPELLRWGTTLEALRDLNASTRTSYDGVRAILGEEESFPVPPSPKGPLTPGRARWRSQLRKLNSLSTGIRGLQAKLHLLREESGRALDDSNDISEVGPHLMSQYESIGVDLKELMTAWEEGKAALALGIDRNEKRLSSVSLTLSPTSSLSGLTTVDEGGAADALKALTGESEPRWEPSEPQTPEIFEAVARPARPRSLLTRNERLVKMREDREQKAQARQHVDATRGMLRELETVISLRPSSRASLPAPGQRIVSL